MTAYRHPDAGIAAWLADGPETLSRTSSDSIKAVARRTRQRSVIVLPAPMLRRTETMRLLLVAAVTVSLLAALAFAAGMIPNVTPEPSRRADQQASPAATHSAPSNPPAGGPGLPLIHGAGRTIALEWSFPADLAYDHGAVYPVFGGEGQQGYFFTFGGEGQYGNAIGGPVATGGTAPHGIVVVDALGATVPYNEGVVLGAIDAATFMSRLGASARFDVGPVTQSDLGPLGGLAANVSGPPLERVAHMDLTLPSRVIAANVAGGIITIQIWAATPEGLAEWLPEAGALLELVHFVQPPIFDCWPQPRPVEIDFIERSGDETLEGTQIRIAYTLPVGQDLVAAAAPGVLGFEQPALEGMTGLSYGASAGLAEAARGLVIGEATSVKGHGLAGESFRSGVDGFLDGLDGVPRVRLENIRDGRGPDGLATRNALVRYDPGPDAWSHVDRLLGPEIGCLIDLTRPNRVSVLEVDGKRIVFQAWAAGDAELARWLPIAQTFIENMHIEVTP